MRDAYGEFEATSLFCLRCRRATPVRRKLLLVLPTGNQFDYVCQVCGAQVGGKLDHDPSAFRQTARVTATDPRPAPPAPRRPPRPGPPRGR